MMNKNVLLLQGPMGPFFKRFAQELALKDANVIKVNFNAGDWIFFPKGRSYRGNYRYWVEYLSKIVEEEEIDQVFLFGDERPYHKIAINKVFKPKAIDVHVFEEGYLRPSFITLEQYGVNGNSRIPKNATSYEKNNEAVSARLKSEKPVVKGQFFKSMVFSVIYGLAKAIGSPIYREYQHHRCLKPTKQGLLWLWGGLFRKPYYHISEKRSYCQIKEKFHKKYFFVPLQVHNDFQISHSPYNDVQDFIEEIVHSFAKHAPQDTVLVFKHHPMDRPYRNYKQRLKELSDQYQLTGRVFYLHDQHLPTLLQNALGTVTINSTVGLSSLYHNIPVLVRGTAVYDISGLTSQLPLKDFWKNPEAVDADLYQTFRLYLLSNNQGHGSFYQKGYNQSPTGIYWPENMNMFRMSNLINEKESVSVLSQRLNKQPVVQAVASGSD
jgi:capsule polysaccharide modification protein KpsS